MPRSAIPWKSGVRELEEPAIGCHNLLPLTLTTCHSLLQTPSPRQPIATHGRLSQPIAGKINVPKRKPVSPGSAGVSPASSKFSAEGLNQQSVRTLGTLGTPLGRLNYPCAAMHFWFVPLGSRTARNPPPQSKFKIQNSKIHPR